MYIIITLVAVLASLMNPVDLKPNYYQEYDLVGEMPEILVTATKPTSEQIKAIGMMPEIQIVAEKPRSENMITGAIPEILVTAPRYDWNQDVKPYYGMMPEVVVTAERYHRLNVMSVLSQMSQDGQNFNQNNTNNSTKLGIYILLTVFVIYGVFVYLRTRFNQIVAPVAVKKSTKINQNYCCRIEK
jgi:hypothetical protein